MSLCRVKLKLQEAIVSIKNDDTDNVRILGFALFWILF